MEVFTQSLTQADGSVLSLETGRLARQADGAVVLKTGDTILLATVVAKKEINPLTDFLPLSVDYKENYSSTGKIPGGFFKRDGRLNEFEILTSRLVDRTLRPMFPEDYHGDTQVIVTVFSSDADVQTDALACVAASAAICVSDLPFPEPVATVRVAYYADGRYVVNPRKSEMEGALLDLTVGGSAQSIVMVEGEMNEVSEEVMLGALQTAHKAIIALCNIQAALRAQVNKPVRDYERPASDEALTAKVNALAEAKMRAIVNTPASKQDRSKAFKALKEEVHTTLFAEDETLKADAVRMRIVNGAYDMLQYNLVRSLILDKQVRLDGRKTDEIRDIWCEVGYLPRAHGSAVFTRGETQSVSTATLGTKLDEQIIDWATYQGTKRFLLQYNFPPFSTGEVKPLRAPSRRETGHGNLAERALKVLLPEDNEYTVRVVSDILESNGSSSMATVCAGCLALMDAGVKIKAPVSGIAMGLIVEGDRYAILSDILGDEDHLGDMDFKTAGTRNGLTACQMDIKVRGLSFEILAKALAQAKRGREHILDVMMRTLDQPREDYSPYAPRLMKMVIPQDMIGAVIGSGGKVIQEIQRTTGTEITIEEIDNMGHVTIASPNKENLEAARERVLAIITVPEIGQQYTGRVKFLKEAGAVLEIMPGKEAWLHISEIAYKRVERVEDVLEVGEEFPVVVTEVDMKMGKIRVSRKALLPKPEGYVERERPARDDRGRGGDRGGRGGDRGGRGGDRRGGRSGYRDNDRGGDREHGHRKHDQHDTQEEQPQA